MEGVSARSASLDWRNRHCKTAARRPPVRSKSPRGPAARSLGVMLNLIEARTSVAIDSAFGRLGTADDVTALIVLGSDFTWLHRERLASLAAAHRSPAIYGNRDSVLAG